MDTVDEDELQQSSLGVTSPVVSPDPLSGPKWGSTAITWSFAAGNLTGQPGGTTFSSSITDAGYRAVVQKAVALWVSVSGITMTLVTDSAAVGIRVGFERLGTGANGTIGLTNTVYSGTPWTYKAGTRVGLEDPAQLALTALPDGDYTYSGSVTQLFQVVVHELGHALGLDHNAVDAGAVMNPTATTANRSIDPNDVRAIETLYGGSSAVVAKVSIGDAGPDMLSVTTGGTVMPFGGLGVVDGAGLHEVVTVTVTGGGTLSDPTAGTDASFSGGVFTESGDNLTVADYAQTVLRRLVYTAPAKAGTASFAVEVDNSLQGAATNAAVRATVTSTNPAIGIVDATTNSSSVATLDSAAAGGPSYLQYQYIFAGNDSLSISTQAANVFIHTGGGTDAVQVASGQNVLDGGLGSNFLTGGTGMDTFFTDARAAGAVWNTIRNFHAGDAATLWGFAAGVSSYRWESSVAGAAGSEGATLRANIVGGGGRTGDGVDASITFTGLSVAQAQGLQIVTGTQAAGSYLFIYNPGV